MCSGMRDVCRHACRHMAVPMPMYVQACVQARAECAGMCSPVQPCAGQCTNPLNHGVQGCASCPQVSLRAIRMRADRGSDQSPSTQISARLREG